VRHLSDPLGIVTGVDPGFGRLPEPAAESFPRTRRSGSGAIGAGSESSSRLATTEEVNDAAHLGDSRAPSAIMRRAQKYAPRSSTAVDSRQRMLGILQAEGLHAESMWSTL